MKILVVTSVFPNCKQPTLGIFVRERMFKVAEHCDLKVIAPVPWFPYAGWIKEGYRPSVPYIETQEGIEVYHPRFFNIPRFFKFLDAFFFFLSAIFTARRIRRQFNFDLIDSHFVYPDGVGAAMLGWLLRKPVTITVRESKIRRLLKTPLLAPQIKVALRSATKVFSVSKDLKDAVTDAGVADEKVVVVPNGVDIKKFNPIDKTEARHELGLPHHRKIIISVGWLIEHKGFHKVISVLPLVKQTFPDILFLIVGGAPVSGNYEPVLRRMVKELGLEDNVIIAGSQPHDTLFKWLSSSDLFCLATRNEGWANVFLEAMACGLPVVTTAVGGNREVVSSDDYGLFFDPGSESDICETIVNALRKNWDRAKIIDYARSNSWNERVIRLLSQFGEIEH
jgi:teichuronic acid biosynthesis glycosyltransferase TuaC